jgi:hypothetical protein
MICSKNVMDWVGKNKSFFFFVKSEYNSIIDQIMMKNLREPME